MRGPMGLFRKRPQEAAASIVDTQVTPETVVAPVVPETDPAREILELLELELGAMIRQLERAANSVAGGAEATAVTLSTIRERTDALTGRTSSAQRTAAMFAQAAEKFTHSAEGIGSQVRGASELADQAGAPARSQRQCGPAAGILGRDRQCRQPDRPHRQADHIAGP